MTATPTPTATPLPQQRIPLHAGWNWFSFAVDPGTTDPLSVLCSLGNSFDFVLGEAGTYAVTPPYAGANTLAGLEAGKGYFIRMIQPAELVLTGARVAADTPAPLTPGWRWIGCLPAGSRSLPGALISVAGSYDYLLGEQGTHAPPPALQFLNSLWTMEPGRGYLLRMAQEGTLIYDPGG